MDQPITNNLNKGDTKQATHSDPSINLPSSEDHAKELPLDQQTLSVNRQKEQTESQTLLQDDKKNQNDSKEQETTKHEDQQNKDDNQTSKSSNIIPLRSKKNVVDVPGTFIVPGKNKLKVNKVVYDPRSLCIFSYKCKPRIWLVKLLHWGPFDTFITVVILLNSLMLAAQDFDDRLYPDYISETNLVLSDIDKGFTCVFLMEFFIKVISMGFVVHKNSYLRDGWNWLDFFVVAISIPDLLPGIESNSSLKALRTFRILRPLRSINSMPRMKELLSALFSSLPGLASVTMFLMFAFSIFGIFGVHQFAGSLYLRCRETAEPILIDGVMQWPINFDADWLCATDADCARMLGEGVVHKCGALVEYGLPLELDKVNDQELISFGIVGFDNLAHGMLTIFQVLTLEGWSGLMYNYMDSNQPTIAIIFLCIIVIFGSFFALNLVLAQIMNSFYEQTEEINRRKEEQQLQEQEEKLREQQEHLQSIQDEETQPKEIQKQQTEIDSPIKLDQKTPEEYEKPKETIQTPAHTYDPQAENKIQSSSSLPMLISTPQTADQIRAFAMRIQEVEDDSNLYNRQSSESANQKEILNNLSNIQSDKQKKTIDVAGNDQSFGIKKDDEQKIPVQPQLNVDEADEIVSENDEDHSIMPVDQQLDDKQDSAQAQDAMSQSLYLDEPDHDRNSRLRSTKNCLFRGCYLLVSNPVFNFFIFLLIIANTIVLSIDGYPQSEQKTRALAIANDFFTIAFMVEMILKLIGLGFKNYVKDSFNLFDGIVVVLSLIDFSLTLSLDAETMGSASEAFAAFRACRLLRVIKIARAWKQLQDILRKTLKSMKDISYFSILLGLFMYIYALLGMELFANKIRYTADGELVYNLQADDIVVSELDSSRTSFDNIFKSLTTIFIVIIGEDWNWVMYDYVRLGGKWYSLYFVSLMIFGNTMLLSLFTAILLQNFEEKEEKDEEEEEDDKDMFQSQRSSTSSSIKKPFKQVIKEKWQGFKEGAYIAFGGKKKLSAPANIVSPVPNDGQDGRVVPVDEQKEQFKDLKLNQQVDNDALQILSAADLFKQRNSSSRMLHYSAFFAKKQKTTKKSIHDVKGRSLFLFSPSNKFRMFMVNVCKHKFFDSFILLLIIISTIMLAIESPLDDPNGEKLYVLEQIDYVMTGLFTLEMVIKIISYGFIINGRYSYLKDPWNVLDFIIVVSSLLSAAPSGLDLSFIKVLRVLRVLRPLRVISKNKDLKVAITSLFNSMPAVINLELVVLFFTFLLAILGTTLFGGKFYYCDTEESALSASEAGDLIKTKWDCYNYGGEWSNPDLHFDNTIYSMLTLVTIQTTEGWIDVMWNSSDMIGIDMQPQLLASWYYIILYMLLIVILCLLFLNLFVGVVIETFNEEKEKLTWNHLLRIVEREYIQVQLLIYNAKPPYKIEMSGNCFRDWCIRFTQNQRFETFIMACICLNTCLLGVQWYAMNESIEEGIQYANYVFMAIFTLEAVLKIIAMKKKYFKDSWNIFDFVVVVGTIIVLVFSVSGVGIDISTQSTILRSLRIGRVFRLVKRAKQLQIIFQTLIVSLPSLGSLGVLLLLLLFLYAIIGVYLFATVQLQEELNYHANFQTFINAFLTLMRCSTGEAWNAIMFDSGRGRSILFQCDEDYDYETYVANGYETTGCGNFGASVAFFLSFQILVSQIFLNLFIAIIVDTYIEYTQKGDLPIVDNHVEDFTVKWVKYDPEATGFIGRDDLEKLLLDLAQTTSNDNWLSANKANIIKSSRFRKNFISFLAIPIYSKFQKYMFYDVMQSLARYNCEVKFYRETHVPGNDIPLSSTMTEQELKAAKRASSMQAYEGFNLMTQQIFDKDERIELVQLLKAKAAVVGKKFHDNIDHGKDDGECYGSAHALGAEAILKVLRRRSQAKRRAADGDWKLQSEIEGQQDAKIMASPTNKLDPITNDDPYNVPQNQSPHQQQTEQLQASIDGGHAEIMTIEEKKEDYAQQTEEQISYLYSGKEDAQIMANAVIDKQQDKGYVDHGMVSLTKDQGVTINAAVEPNIEKFDDNQRKSNDGGKILRDTLMAVDLDNLRGDAMEEAMKTIAVQQDESSYAVPIQKETIQRRRSSSIESDAAEEIIKNANKGSVSRQFQENDRANQVKNELEDVLSSSQQ